MSKKVETTEIAIKQEETGELAVSGAAAAARYEIESAIIISRKLPRNEDMAFQKLMKATDRTSFAEGAAYSFPRGGAKVEGPSINLAREAARVWGNIRYGLEIVRDDEESRQIKGWAWDLETNVKTTAEDDFKKLIFRKNKDGKDGGIWIKPDERDLRELTFRSGAILMRNCLLNLLPKDLIEDALTRCRETLKKGAEKDPEAARKRLILAFSELNVTPDRLEEYLGHKLAESSPAEIAELRTIYQSIKDGNSTWNEYLNKEKSGPESGKLNMNDLKPGTEANRGHGNENLAPATTPTSQEPEKTPAAPSAGAPAGSQEGDPKRKKAELDIQAILLDLSPMAPIDALRDYTGYEILDDIPDEKLNEIKVKLTTKRDAKKAKGGK